jgi:uncharacterized protein YndB with AHSA1/START domain
MTDPQFVYTTYIRSTPERVWAAITNPEFARQYWGGNENISDWKKGSGWRHVSSDENRSVYVIGEVVESAPPNRLVLTWIDPADATDTSRVIFEVEAVEDMVRLSVTHRDFKSGSDMVHKISGGWPRVLSSMKSFLETGEALNVWAMKGGCAKPAKGAAA